MCLAVYIKTYMHTISLICPVRQYLPYRRMKECFQDIFGIGVSEGSLVSAVRRVAYKSLPIYNRIKRNIIDSPVVGADETGAKVNGKKAWFWTWRTPEIPLLRWILAEGIST